MDEEFARRLTGCVPVMAIRDIEAWGVHCAARIGLSEPYRIEITDALRPSEIACATPGVIRLMPGIPEFACRAIIAHEAAHLRQFELGARGLEPSTESALEREADLAMRQICLGGSFIIREPALTGPLLWNRFGHFYTVLCLLLTAGWPHYTAVKVALAAQLPDMALELDAMTMSVTTLFLYLFRHDSPIDRETWTRFCLSSLYDGSGKLLGTKENLVIPSTYQDAAMINIGLHSLTGRSTGVERTARGATLNRSKYDSVEFGLGIHAYGDAFAHCANGSMFRPIQGHALLGHDPDCTSGHMREYDAYISSLWDIIWAKRSEMPSVDGRIHAAIFDTLPGAKNEKDKRFAAISKFLDGVASRPEFSNPELEKRQIGSTEEYLTRVFGVPVDTQYKQPGYDGAPLAGLNLTYMHYKQSDVTLENLTRIAKEWTQKTGAMTLVEQELTLNPMKNDLQKIIAPYFPDNVLSRLARKPATYLYNWLFN